MLSKGNGQTQVCVNNLLQIPRGSVPYERVKGLDPRLFDQPAAIARDQLMADAEWLIETFEPRADLTGSALEDLAAETGDFGLKATIETN